MFKLYKNNRLSQVLLLIIVIVLIVVEMIISQRITFTQSNAITLVILTILNVIFIYTNIMDLLHDPYSDLRKLRHKNPDLVNKYSEEFDNAKKIGYNVWLGTDHVFLRTPDKFYVLEFLDLRQVCLFQNVNSETLEYCINVVTPSDKINVIVSTGYAGKDIASACMKELSEVAAVTIYN